MAPRGLDLIEQYKLTTELKPDCTIHTFYEADPARQKRRVQSKQKWVALKALGQGGSGIVYLEREKRGELRAVKKVAKLLRERDNHDSLRELLSIATLSKDHTNFPTFHGWYEDQWNIYIAMEYFRFGDLQQCMSTLSSPPTEKEARLICFQITEALEAIHDLSITHRDIKPSNVFVLQKSPHWRVKVGDFGISKRVKNEETALHTVFYGAYVAPEILGLVDIDDENAMTYTSAVDIWSLGCLAYWVMTGTDLFTIQALRRYCKTQKLPQNALDKAETSEEGLSFIRTCLETAPEQRPTVVTALELPWLKDRHFDGSADLTPSSTDKMSESFKAQAVQISMKDSDWAPEAESAVAGTDDDSDATLELDSESTTIYESMHEHRQPQTSNPSSLIVGDDLTPTHSRNLSEARPVSIFVPHSYARATTEASSQLQDPSAENSLTTERPSVNQSQERIEFHSLTEDDDALSEPVFKGNLNKYMQRREWGEATLGIFMGHLHRLAPSYVCIKSYESLGRIPYKLLSPKDVRYLSSWLADDTMLLGLGAPHPRKSTPVSNQYPMTRTNRHMRQGSFISLKHGLIESIFFGDKSTTFTPIEQFDSSTLDSIREMFLRLPEMQIQKSLGPYNPTKSAARFNVPCAPEDASAYLESGTTIHGFDLYSVFVEGSEWPDMWCLTVEQRSYVLACLDNLVADTKLREEQEISVMPRYHQDSIIDVTRDSIIFLRGGSVMWNRIDKATSQLLIDLFHLDWDNLQSTFPFRRWCRDGVDEELRQRDLLKRLSRL